MTGLVVQVLSGVLHVAGWGPCDLIVMDQDAIQSPMVGTLGLIVRILRITIIYSAGLGMGTLCDTFNRKYERPKYKAGITQRTCHDLKDRIMR